MKKKKNSGHVIQVSKLIVQSVSQSQPVTSYESAIHEN